MIKKAFPVLGFSIFASMLGVGIVVPLLPLYAEKMGATGIWIGMIFAGFSISRTIVMPIAGRLSDRRGRKLFLGVGLLVYAIVSLGYIWAGNVFQLTMVRFVQGIAAGMVIPIAQAYVGDLSPKSYCSMRGRKAKLLLQVASPNFNLSCSMTHSLYLWSREKRFTLYSCGDG